MNPTTLFDLIERIDEIIDILTNEPTDCYIPLDLAYQLRDELMEVNSDQIEEE